MHETSPSPPPSLVWFKRDLRLHDHAALAAAAAHGPVLCLFIYEPEVIEGPEFDGSHLVFINQSLAELDDGLRARGGRLIYRHGEAVSVLDELHRTTGFTTLYSHEETGLGVTYARDRRVKRFCRERGIRWVEPRQNGVVRRLGDRDGWAALWDRTMNRPEAPGPERIVRPTGWGDDAPGAVWGHPLDERALGLEPSHKPDAQRGGEREALATLDSFLTARGVNYRADMSSPNEGWTGCSRISPHLAWGTLSLKRAWQQTGRRVSDLRIDRDWGRPVDPRWFDSLKSFQGRLHWHCHFIQKLEDEPRIEFENISRVYDGLRENDWDESRFGAFTRGETGYPLIDACIRCLLATGWINFRMRAMLVSFSSYHLWLHWRRPALFLARHFLDFEPGIHFSQVQMQSGTTGINTVRIYAPTKQVHDNDPQGAFIRRWVPELANVPAPHIAEPHAMPPLLAAAYGFRPGVTYPLPVVDHAAAMKRARERVFRIRATVEAKAEAQAVYQRHGSRKRPSPRGPTGAKAPHGYKGPPEDRNGADADG